MLQIGMVEPSDGAYSSPLAAQDGKVDRFCVGYRKPIEVTKAVSLSRG